jgi:hypothetical protein
MTFTPMGTLGGDIWEWWHADTVQREYEAVGKVPPTIEEIESGAYADAVARVEEQVKAVGFGAGFLAFGIIGAVLMLMAVRKP